jgi:hypothetical protein
MNESEHHSPYSWHQSHDQATVLLVVPYETLEEDVTVVIEKNYLLAGVRGQNPIVKGRLYGNVDSGNSAWQLEPRSSRLLGRERTISTISTTSTQSSYAFVSDPEISSSFAASLESGHTSDADDLIAQSPALSSPLSTPPDERPNPTSFQRRTTALNSSRPVSPGRPARSVTSSISSLDSLHSSHSGRLLTLHLEKDKSIIWPSLIVGPIDVSLSPCVPNPFLYDPDLEHQYNMDPTSLVLIGLELFDIREKKEESFEFLVRAWHQARVPSATLRLTMHYFPSQVNFEFTEPDENVPHGTITHYLQCIGGPSGLAQLYLEAGMLHLEGAAKPLLSSSYSTLSSIRMPPHVPPGEDGNDARKRDREAASRYFERARTLQPGLEVPVLSPESTPELEMPSLEIHPSAPASVYSGDSPPDRGVRRRRKKEEMTLLDDVKADDTDNSWYLYVPGLVGAGTALLVVGVVGALSFSTWRRNQGS